MLSHFDAVLVSVTPVISYIFLIFWLNSIPSIFRISSELSSATWTISNPSPVPTLMSSLVSFKCVNPTSHFTCQHWALEQKISPCCLLVAFGIVTFTYIYYPLTVQNAWEEGKRPLTASRSQGLTYFKNHIHSILIQPWPTDQK